MSSEKDIESETTLFLSAFDGKETEENWESREKMLQRLRGVVRGNGTSMAGFIPFIKSIIDPLLQTVCRLSVRLF